MTNKPSGGSDALTLQEQAAIMEDMTPEQIERGMHPRTFADLRYRASAFAKLDQDKLTNPPVKEKGKK